MESETASIAIKKRNFQIGASAGLRAYNKMRNGRVARDLGLVQGARRENIRRDIRPTSNAAAAPKIGNPEGRFLAGARQRCSSVTERFGYAPSSRLAGRPPENSAPIPHFVIGS